MSKKKDELNMPGCSLCGLPATTKKIIFWWAENNMVYCSNCNSNLLVAQIKELLPFKLAYEQLQGILREFQTTQEDSVKIIKKLEDELQKELHKNDKK